MKLFKLVPAVATLILAAGAAEAAIVQEIKNFSSQPIGTSFDIVVNKFNPALGTLTSINFQFAASSQGSTLTFDNATTSSGSANLTLQTELKAMTGIALPTFVMFAPGKNGSGTVGPDNDALEDFVGTDSFSISTGVLNGSGSVLRTTAPYLAQFTATAAQPTYAVTFSSKLLPTSVVNGVTGILNATPGTYSGTLTVTYTYAPIPEPGSAFWGLALGMFVGCRRMRARRA